MEEKKKAVNYKSKVMVCSCLSDYQDKTYGHKKRLFNKKVKQGKENGYRCTVCGNSVIG